MIPELKKLWKECFADEDAYINAFFDVLYKDHDVLLEEENGVLMGASFFLPGEIYLEPTARLKGRPDSLYNGRQPCSGRQGKWQEIRYVYALAVYPRFRGQGLAAALLRRAHEVYHAPLVAEPAEEGLVGGFYAPLGFSQAFYLEKKWMEVPQYDVRAAEILPEQSFRSGRAAAKAEEYCLIRDAYFQKHGYIRWPVKHVEFAIQEHCSSGGGAYVFREDGREDILLYYREEQDVIVTETTLTEQEAADLFFSGIFLECSRMIFTGAAVQPDIAGKAEQAGQSRRVQEETGLRIIKQQYCLTGMSYGLPSMYGYLNLSLD